jgi:glutathione S-transferase
MQKIVDDVLAPKDQKNPQIVIKAQEMMTKGYSLLEERMRNRQWILGDVMSIADCAALPALFYGQFTTPYQETHPNCAAYFERIYARPAVQRLMQESKPFFQYFPLNDRMPARFR